MLRKIIKCPHCQSEVRILEHRGEERGFLLGMQAVCSGCDMRGPEVSVGAFTADVAKARAADEWNTMARRLGASYENVTLYRDSVLTPGKRRATAKQISYARAIAERLGIDPPVEMAKDIYTGFISTHVAEYKKRAPHKIYGYC